MSQLISKRITSQASIGNGSSKLITSQKVTYEQILQNNSQDQT